MRPTSYINYETYIEKHIKNEIGGYQLCALNSLIIQQFINERSRKGRLDGEGGLSPKTIKNMYNILHKALDQAVALDMLPKNPADHVVLPKRQKPDMRFFTVEEQRQLQEAIKGHRLEMAILLMLYTGIRQGELLGLPWKNVHLDPNGQSYIRITQALCRIKNMDNHSANKTMLSITVPKTAYSIRTIPLLPEIADKLIDYRAKQQAFLKENSLPDRGLVFLTTTGTLIEPRDFQRDYKKILHQHNIRIVNVHGLRHTFATRSLESGMDVKTLSTLLGHANVRFTLSTYAHVTEELKVEQISNLQCFL